MKLIQSPLAVHQRLIQKNLLVVRELGSRWTRWLNLCLRDIDNAIVLVQQVDESEQLLRDRAARRIESSDSRRSQFGSAVIACRDDDDPQALRARYLLAKRLLCSLAKGGRLAFAVDEGASLRCKSATLDLARRLSREWQGTTISLCVAMGSQIWHAHPLAANPSSWLGRRGALA